MVAHSSIDHTGLPGVGAASSLSYVEKTSSTTITATTEATGQTIVSSASLAYGGSTLVEIAVFIPEVSIASTGAAGCIIDLWEDSTAIGRFATPWSGTTTTDWRVPVFAIRRRTPSAATHQYHIKAWKSGTATVAVDAGAGGTGALMPAFIRITNA